MTIKKRLLLHICCVGCGAYVVEGLSQEHDIALFFCNPNIYPASEHALRLDEAKKISERLGVDLIIADDNHSHWLGMVQGLEAETEKGKRCLLCYQDRMEKTAVYAKANGFDIFGTTLTTSPHKDAAAISSIGQEIARKEGIEYLDADFKKKDGFKKSCELSKELGLYRQDYCGCEFSIRKKS